MCKMKGSCPTSRRPTLADASANSSLRARLCEPVQAAQFSPGPNAAVYGQTCSLPVRQALAGFFNTGKLISCHQ